MKTFLKITLPLLALAVGIALAVWLITTRPEIPHEPPPRLIPTVRAEPAHATDFQVEVETQGTVVPRTESALTAQVGGRVVAVSPALVAGGFFEAGEVLVELEARDYELALAQAELSVAQAERRLAEEQADAAVARREWEELGEGEPSALTLREPQVKEARAALAAAEAGRALAALELERTRLKATFAGRVRSKNVDLGQFVMPGAVVARVYAVDTAEVRLPLPDQELRYLELPLAYGDGEDDPSPRARLSAVFAGARREWSARIVRTEGEIDPRTRMVMAVAEVEDPYGLHAAPGERGVPLAVGMFVSAAIEGVTLEDVFVLSRAALRDDERIYVLEHHEDRDVLRMVEVEILHTTRDEVIVRGPQLRDGMRVVLSPLEIATDGMEVRDLAVDAGTTEGGEAAL